MGVVPPYDWQTEEDEVEPAHRPPRTLLVLVVVAQIVIVIASR